MKTIMVKNIQIQFDQFGDTEDTNSYVCSTLCAINKLMHERMSDICPQIVSISGLDKSDIEVLQGEEEEF